MLEDADPSILSTRPCKVARRGARHHGIAVRFSESPDEHSWLNCTASWYIPVHSVVYFHDVVLAAPFSIRRFSPIVWPICMAPWSTSTPSSRRSLCASPICRCPGHLDSNDSLDYQMCMSGRATGGVHGGASFAVLRASNTLRIDESCPFKKDTGPLP